MRISTCLPVLLSATLLAGCVFPVQRTFYEPDPRDGTPSPRTGCGYFFTRDSVIRSEMGVRVHLQPGATKLPAERSLDLEVGIYFSYDKDNVLSVDPSLIQLQIEAENKVLSPHVVDTYDSSERVQPPNYRQRFKRLSLSYPEPAGLQDHLFFLFTPGAVTIDGRQLPSMQFRFNRIEKTDLYQASINC